MTQLLRKEYRSRILLLVLIAVIWFGFSPIQLGGQVAYVIISGNSMEPAIHVGDLVITRKKNTYEVGQRVVYNHPKLGHVFHRIVDRDSEAFIFKGDNNQWLDTYYPTASELIGKFWFKVPGGGEVIRILRDPVYFTAFTLVILLIIGSLIFFKNEEEGKTGKKKSRKIMENNKFQNTREYRQELLFLFGIIAVAALILGWIAYSRPLTIKTADDVLYSHRGELRYTAKEDPGVYDRATIVTGDPVYLRLTCVLDLDFNYQFYSPRQSMLEQVTFDGNYLINAIVSDSDGWNRSVSLVPETGFSGTTVDSSLDLDICAIQSLINKKEQKTGTGNRIYNLTIYPEVSVAGKVSEISFEDIYRPEFLFQIDSKVMRIPDGVEELVLDQEGSLPNKREVNNSLMILGRSFDIEKIRQVAVIAFVLSLTGAVFPAYSLYRDWKESEESRIKVQYQSMMLEVEEGSLPGRGFTKIEVASIQELARMAESYGAMILHEAGEKVNRYTVQDEKTFFQYTLENPSEEVD